jgi:hypothetical protein
MIWHGTSARRHVCWARQSIALAATPPGVSVHGRL